MSFFRFQAPTKHGGRGAQDDGAARHDDRGRSKTAPPAFPTHGHDAGGRRSLRLCPGDSFSVGSPEGRHLRQRRVPPTDDRGDQDGHHSQRPSPEDAHARLPVWVPAASHFSGRVPATGVRAILRCNGSLRVRGRPAAPKVPLSALGQPPGHAKLAGRIRLW